MFSFSFSQQPIDANELKARLANPKAGAVNTFEGLVRNHNDGRSVLSLEYEAYETLAVKEAARIIGEAKEKFDIYDVVCVHRTGTLAIGDMAVFVGVSSAHRGTAFGACQYVIDEIKSRLPIWKRETYADGSSGWVNCQSCAHHDGTHASTNMPAGMSALQQEADERTNLQTGRSAGILPASNSAKPLPEQEYYSRQMLLPAVAEAGQEKLRAAKVLVVGAGGLGSSALLYLAGAGFGTIGICDSDNVELSNLHRQVLYSTADIGTNKAQAAAQHLRRHNPFIQINVHPERFNNTNAVSLFTAYDIILDCSDNFPTKFLANDTALSTGRTLVQASVYQYEGQIHLIHCSDKASYEGQCLRCLWPNASAGADELACAVGSCAEVGVLGVVPGTFGTLQALEATKYVLQLPTALTDHVLFLDLLTYETRKLKRLQRPDCVSCAPYTVPGAGGKNQAPADRLLNDPNQSTDPLHKTYAQTGEIGDDLVVIDVREPAEVHQSDRNPKDFWPRAQVINVPFSSWSREIPSIDADTICLVVCALGGRSIKAARQLRAAGCAGAYSLSGGMQGIEKAESQTGVATGARA
jgi:adenylyltransferase/sulfurtransferase